MQHYYHTFDTNRAGLASLYQPNSYLTLEGKTHCGVQAIMEALSRLPFARCERKIDTMDIQPSPSSGLFVFATGALMVRATLWLNQPMLL